jgi:hypothetical protein
MQIYKIRVNEEMVYNIKAHDQTEAIHAAMNMFDSDFGPAVAHICEVIN